jgi:excisionase family DNA binding protein
MERRADLLTVAEAGRYIGCSRWTVYRLVRTGQLPAGLLVGRRLCLRRADIDAWVDSKFRPASVDPQLRLPPLPGGRQGTAGDGGHAGIAAAPSSPLPAASDERGTS